VRRCAATTEAQVIDGSVNLLCSWIFRNLSGLVSSPAVTSAMAWSLSTRNPSMPGRTNSPTPPEAIATTASPAQRASSAATPNDSSPAGAR
jgi:hypothetical protein